MNARTDATSEQKPIAGYIVANGTSDRFRCWRSEGPAWTERKSEALVFARRIDAESFAAEDEDAWHITPVSPDELE